MAKKKAKQKSAPKKKAAKAKKKVAHKKPAKKKAAPKKKAVKKASAKPAPKPVEKPSTMVNPYLTFNGNCEEAFNFYRSVFGGQFSYVGRFNEMPPMEGHPAMAESEGRKIMHVSLPISKQTILMGSDTVEGGPVITFGNNFSVSVSAVSDADADRIYNGLAEGGHQTMPMAHQFWGSYFGMLTDKFGMNWMVSHETPKDKK